MECSPAQRASHDCLVQLLASCQTKSPNVLTQELAGQGCRERPGVTAAGIHWLPRLTAGRQGQRKPSVGRPREWGTRRAPELYFLLRTPSLKKQGSRKRLCRHTAARAQTGIVADPSWLMRGGPCQHQGCSASNHAQRFSRRREPPFINRSMRMASCKAVR
jgi:hypothetical protein